MLFINLDLTFEITEFSSIQVAEGLFNFVIGWTFMFAPLLFADSKRDRYKGSLDVLWGFQMFLTNSTSTKLSCFTCSEFIL